MNIEHRESLRVYCDFLRTTGERGLLTVNQYDHALNFSRAIFTGAILTYVAKFLAISTGGRFDRGHIDRVPKKKI